MARKKYLILYILKILESNTDEKHPMSQKQIVDIITAVMDCDRKTVSRNVKFLQEMGYPIVKGKRGCYMAQKKFTIDEINFIIHAMQSTPSSDMIDRDDLIKKTQETLTKMIARK